MPHSTTYSLEANFRLPSTVFLAFWIGQTSVFWEDFPFFLFFFLPLQNQAMAFTISCASSNTSHQSFQRFGAVIWDVIGVLHHMEEDNGQDAGHTLIFGFLFLSSGSSSSSSCLLVVFVRRCCVHAKGETLLHRACKKNQVETVLKILTLPDCDVNVKDHAGWTPLHEACNHGSTACVQALLHHWPAPVVNSQVGGVSPLHDALLNGHMDIARLLLEHAGSVILQQKDQHGKTPLDLLSDAAQREELLDCARSGDTARRKRATKVQNLPLLEAASFLLTLLIMSYQKETGLHAVTGDAGPRNLRQKMLSILRMHSFEKVSSAWSDQRVVRLLQDVQTLMDVGRVEIQQQHMLLKFVCKLSLYFSVCLLQLLPRSKHYSCFY
uniref:Ankyrin repeat domain 32 n=1 Tax=Neogobius melanostomus TaxID=47308 RepID=A0A8C6UR66_9GOBI